MVDIGSTDSIYRYPHIVLSCDDEDRSSAYSSVYGRLLVDRAVTDGLLEEDGGVKAFVNGLVTDQPDLTDAMYDDPHLYTPEGSWQMIFSVVTAPAHRHEGCASRVLRQVCADAKAAGRKGVVLTCKERLIGFYAQFGFVDEGVSVSTHGDVVWHQMRLTF